MTKGKEKFYIDKDELFQKFVEYRKELDEAKESGKPRPKVPDTIILDAYKIIKNYSRQKKFYNMSEELLEDGVSKGLEFCMKYLHNFDIYKKTSTNQKPSALAYITQYGKNGIYQVFNSETKIIDKNMHYISSQLASGTYIRSDGEIDMMSSGEFSKNSIKEFDRIKHEYEKDHKK